MRINDKVAAIGAMVFAGIILAGCGKSDTATAPASNSAAPIVDSSTAPPAEQVLGQESAALPTPGGASAGGGNVQPKRQRSEAEQGREGKLSNVDKTKKFLHYRVGEKNVKAIYADGKVIWIGTSGGVVRYDTQSNDFKVIDSSNGLLSNGAFYVGKVKGHIAIGTYGGGLSILEDDGVTWKNYNIPEGVGDPFVYGVLEAKNGDIWLATWSGANRVRGGALDDPSKWDLFTVENTRGGLPNDWVYALAEGKNGEIWLATEGGMARFVNGKWDNWNHKTGIGAPYEKVKSAIAFKSDPGKASDHHAKQKKEMGLENVDVAYNPNYIVSLKVDRKGDVWAGTWGGGLSHFNGKAWNTFSTVEGLPGNHVFMLHEDLNGQLWIGTNKGLALWQKGHFKVMTRADGLLGDDVFAMTTTPDGAMWIGSYGGVAYLRPAK